MSAPAVAAVRERPILFSGEMVRAILDGRKTQTRRVVVPQPQPQQNGALLFIRGDRQFQWFDGGSMPDVASACPFGGVGDRLWVRETWFGNNPGGAEPEPETFHYRATEPGFDVNGRSVWRGAIIMPRKASRLTLEVTAVRVERVQQISGADAREEGIEPYPRVGAVLVQYRQLWDDLNAKRGYGWDVNPWVWVVEFRRVQ